MIQSTILTKKALEVIDKRLKNQKLTQQDSNYLSRFVRPKLRGIVTIDAKTLLKKIEYNPRAKAIEQKIKKIMLRDIPNVAAIILCGSAIQTNYQKYNDLDVIVATKKRLSEQLKKELIKKLEESGKKEGLSLDLQIYTKDAITHEYPSNPSLIYQLKDSKCIYGKINLSHKINLSRLKLQMKLDWSEGFDLNSSGIEIYHAIRNAMLVSLLMNKKVDNTLLRENIIKILGESICARLQKSIASPQEKKLALMYLRALVSYLETELKEPQWEKIVIESL